MIKLRAFLESAVSVAQRLGDPLARRKEEQRYDEYRTKPAILEISDETQEAMDTEQPYETRPDPPPTDSEVMHEARNNAS